MPDYVGREEIKDLLRELQGEYLRSGERDKFLGAHEAFRKLQDIPAADVQIVVHGKWDVNGCCSNCGEQTVMTEWDEPIYDYDWDENLRLSYIEHHVDFVKTNYCPHCGARMDGDEK